jgi:glycerol-3-phosphate dehydrogenase (NAD(P)+)
MRIAVLGAGSWGTTLGSLLARGNHTVLWSRDADVADEVTRERRNSTYLPDVQLDPTLRATCDLGAALEDAELVLLAVPSKYLRSVLERAVGLVPATADLISVAKGIEVRTGLRMTEVIVDVLAHDPTRVGALSGPNLAKEVAAGQPSTTVLATPDQERAVRLRHAMTTPTFRVFSNPDVIGCEVGGAAKNVIAIAAGIGDGLGFGWNTKAALITRGLTEITRLGTALGASPITFLGLAGDGDLIATCSSPQSRNRHVGEQLGRGRALDAIIDDMKMVAEGVSTTGAIVELADRLDVPMPITRRVQEVLTATTSPEEAVRRLMSFEPGEELDGLTRDPGRR